MGTESVVPWPHVPIVQHRSPHVESRLGFLLAQIGDIDAVNSEPEPPRVGEQVGHLGRAQADPHRAVCITGEYGYPAQAAQERVVASIHALSSAHQRGGGQRAQRRARAPRHAEPARRRNPPASGPT
jgi:hypothetical protein